MSKVTLTYYLPEDQVVFNMARCGEDFYGELIDIQRWLKEAMENPDQFAFPQDVLEEMWNRLNHKLIDFNS